MDLAAIARRRLATQGLADPRFVTPEDVVRWLGAVQSQEYAPAKWSLGQRMRCAREVDIDEALRSGAVLRTHVLRPTWHFVAAEDIRWLLAATAGRVHALNAGWYRRLELDRRLMRRAYGVIARALEGGHHLTRREIGDALGAAGIHAEGQRLAYIVMHAELDGLICSGESSGKQRTYALLGERVPGGPAPDEEEARAELARRYFTGHGPATAKDLVWWSSLTVAQAERAIDAARSHLERFEVDGETYWAGDPPREAAEPSPTAHLLQGFDEYLAYGPSRTVFDLAGLGFRAGPQLPFGHVLIVDGQVAGRWRYAPGSGRARVELQPLRPLSARERRAVTDAAERYGRFAGAAVQVV